MLSVRAGSVGYCVKQKADEAGPQARLRKAALHAHGQVHEHVRTGRVVAVRSVVEGVGIFLVQDIVPAHLDRHVLGEVIAGRQVQQALTA